MGGASSSQVAHAIQEATNPSTTTPTPLPSFAHVDLDFSLIVPPDAALNEVRQALEIGFCTVSTAYTANFLPDDAAREGNYYVLRVSRIQLYDFTQTTPNQLFAGDTLPVSQDQRLLSFNEHLNPQANHLSAFRPMTTTHYLALNGSNLAEIAPLYQANLDEAWKEWGAAGAKLWRYTAELSMTPYPIQTGPYASALADTLAGDEWPILAYTRSNFQRIQRVQVRVLQQKRVRSGTCSLVLPENPLLSATATPTDSVIATPTLPEASSPIPPSASPFPTSTLTLTLTASPTPTASLTLGPTRTSSYTLTPTVVTPSATSTIIPSATHLPTNTNTPTTIPSTVPTWTPSITHTPLPTNTPDLPPTMILPTMTASITHTPAP